MEEFYNDQQNKVEVQPNMESTVSIAQTANDIKQGLRQSVRAVN